MDRQDTTNNVNTRPQPPEHLGKFDEDGEFPKMLVPAPELAECVNTVILVEDGTLQNPDHSQLTDADLYFLRSVSEPSMLRFASVENRSNEGMVSKKQDLLPTMSSGDIGRLMAEVAQRELKGWSDKGLLIRTYGVLTNLSAQRKFAGARNWQRIFGVVLDADGPLTVNAPKDLLESFDDGDMIEIVGYPIINVFRGTISVQLEVQGARHAESDGDQEKRRVVQSNLAALQSLKPSRNTFPLLPTVSVDVIHSSASSAQVDEDFYNGLGEQADRCKINAVPIRITSAKEIAAAIQASDAKVLVVIRGGGPEADFAVFNDAEVLSALAEKTSYRVMGIGHSGNTTLVDLIADFSARVPAEAGAHIRDHLRHLDDLVGAYEDALEKRGAQIDALAAEVKKTQDESKAEISRLHDSFKSQRPQPTQNNKVLWAAIAFLLLVLIFK